MSLLSSICSFFLQKPTLYSTFSFSPFLFIFPPPPPTVSSLCLFAFASPPPNILTLFSLRRSLLALWKETFPPYPCSSPFSPHSPAAAVWVMTNCTFRWRWEMLVFVWLIIFSTGSLIRGNAGRTWEMGETMCGYLFVTFWDIYRGKCGLKMHRVATLVLYLYCFEYKKKKAQGIKHRYYILQATLRQNKWIGKQMSSMCF